MSALRVCTIIARNYWARARVLARSILDQDPDARLVALVIDADERTLEAAERERFEVMSPDDLGLERAEFLRMAGIYDILEFSTSLKPWLLRRLLEIDEAPVVYLDPDIEVFAPLEGVMGAAAEHGIVLTPHTLEPPSREPDQEEFGILLSGAYNLGFIAVGQKARPFLDWWAERLRRYCLTSKAEGMFVDQRWVDLAPAYFQAHAIRDPGWNVAYWNLPSRKLSVEDDRISVDGSPLRFFHYSGFDPDRPRRLSKYQRDDVATEITDDPVLFEMCTGYAQALIRSGHRAHSRVVYPYDRASAGFPLDIRARHVYRRGLLRAEAGEEPEPPSPFDERHPRAFEAWLNEPVGPHDVSRYLREVYDSRPDVRAAFPDIEGRDARLFVDWIRAEGSLQEQIPEVLVPRAPIRSRIGGVNLAGYTAAENGVGEAARLLASAFQMAGIPVSVKPYRNTPSRQEAPETIPSGPTHNTNVVCVNADQFPTFAQDAAELFEEGRYTVGVWAWELEVFPEPMSSASNHVDEIWTYSEHAARGIREQTQKPVFVSPPPIVRPFARAATRADLGLPEGFLFLYCFDFDSVFERKNPLGVVEAFKQAFPAAGDARLVVKSVRGEAHPQKLDLLRRCAEDRPDIQVMDGYLHAHEQHALMASCDAYVSLHRSEGFGLTLAEAMAYGKPVIATAYSGNLEFMDETNSRLIGYQMTQVPAGCDPYPEGAPWAEPDIDEAAESMRALAADPASARRIGRRAAEDVARLHGPGSRAPFIVSRLEAIEGLRVTRESRGMQAPWRSLDSAAHYVRSGPDTASSARYGGASKGLRRMVLRVIRHYAEHQERVQSSLIESLEVLQERLEAERAATARLEARVRELEMERIYDDRPPASDPEPGGEQGSAVRPFREGHG